MMAILVVFFVGSKVQAAFPDQTWGPNIYQITSSSIEVGPVLIDENWLDVISWRVFYDNQVTDWLSTEYFSWQHQGLEENSLHNYQVQFMDQEGNLSEASPMVSRYTKVSPPSIYNSYSGRNNITIKVSPFEDDQEGLSGYMFDNITLDTSSGWVEQNKWTDNNLRPDTNYTYRIKFKNAEGFVTEPLIINLRTKTRINWLNLSIRSIYP